MLEITKNMDGSTAQITLKGRLDASSAADFERIITDLPSETDAITLDFADLRWLSSAGLRVILLAQKLLSSKQASVTIINANTLTMEILDATGFTDIMTVQPAEDAQ